ncbi:hypothetical protein V7S43_018003 [Phytophthora oleae]|uniref:BZIP domain-containing protein n=1 Tax=Phytophthora oleae TaxID=2107226 RepID=A0ABD3ERJ1_9STRA
MDAASLSALTQFLHEFRSSEFDTLDDGRSETDTLSPTSTASETGQPGATRSSSQRINTTNSNAADGSAKRRRTVQSNKRQNRYLAKVRGERETLRQQVTQLSTALQELKKAQARSAAQAAGDFSLAAWKSTAVRQKELRLEAEAKQRRLKALVEEQTRVVRSMNELLQQRMVCGPTPSLQTRPPADGPLFKVFAQELDALYAITNDVVGGADFKLSARPLQFELTRDWSQDMTFLESVHATAIPFGFEETSRALTRALLENANGTCARNNEPKNTTALRRYMDFTHELGASASLILHSVVRKYVEADRVVFVWRALTEGQGDFMRLYTDETAWYVLRPATEGSSLVLETYTRLVPVGFSLTSEADARGNAFVKVLAKADEEDVDDIMQMFEQMLTDQAHTVCS